MDWLKKFFSDPSNAVLSIMVSSGVLGFFVGIANGVIQKRHGGWGAFFTSAITGTIIATMVGLLLSEYVKSQALHYALVAFCAIISDDIWAGLQSLGTMFRKNPLETIFRVLDAVRGRTPSAPPLPPAGPMPKED